MRTGRKKSQLPIYGPGLSNGDFAQLGIRDDIRFVKAGTRIGAFSSKPKTRSRYLNRGAIVEVSDTAITYATKDITNRTEQEEGTKPNRYGPLLPYSLDSGLSGVVEMSVTASVDGTESATRKDVDRILLYNNAEEHPRKWPFFWSYQNRKSNWLMESSAPVFYEVSGESAKAYEELNKVGREMGLRGGCYIDHAERAIFGMESNKGNAGAGKLLDRNVMSVGTQIAAFFHLNFMPLTFSFPSGLIHFFPEEIVYVNYDGACSFIPYSEISYEVSGTTHMGVPVPSWCQSVGYTWQYMNRDGGPDRRYSYNPQIFHYEVWELDFIFPGGRIDTAFADAQLLTQFTNRLDVLISLSKNRKD